MITIWLGLIRYPTFVGGCHTIGTSSMPTNFFFLVTLLNFYWNHGPSLSSHNACRIQRPQNCAVHLLYHPKKYDHITSYLIQQLVMVVEVWAIDKISCLLPFFKGLNTLCQSYQAPFKFYTRFFCYQAISWWIPLLDVLKEHTFMQIFIMCQGCILWNFTNFLLCVVFQFFLMRILLSLLCVYCVLLCTPTRGNGYILPLVVSFSNISP